MTPDVSRGCSGDVCKFLLRFLLSTSACSQCSAPTGSHARQPGLARGARTSHTTLIVTKFDYFNLLSPLMTGDNVAQSHCQHFLGSRINAIQLRCTHSVTLRRPSLVGERICAPGRAGSDSVPGHGHLDTQTMLQCSPPRAVWCNAKWIISFRVLRGFFAKKIMNRTSLLRCVLPLDQGRPDKAWYNCTVTT